MAIGCVDALSVELWLSDLCQGEKFAAPYEIIKVTSIITNGAEHLEAARQRSTPFGL